VRPHYDHTVVFVEDLKTAINQFSTLGFTVTLGGAHKHTENALIIFQDKTYIELIALKENWLKPALKFATHFGVLNRIANNRKDMSWRLYRWIAPKPGPVDWCIRVEDVDDALELMMAQNIECIPAEPFQRERPDGKTAKWKLGTPKNLDLPFLLSDTTAVEIRVPLNNTTTHPNGVHGLHRVIVSVSDKSDFLTKFSTLFDSQAIDSESNDQDMKLGQTQVSLVERTNGTAKLSLELSYNGDTHQQLDREKTNNLTITLVPV